MLRRNGTCDTLKAPINSYPCKYESFKRDYKIVGMDTTKLDTIYFSCRSKIKTRKRSENICKIYQRVVFHTGPVWQDQTHFRPRHSLRSQSVALSPNLLCPCLLSCLWPQLQLHGFLTLSLGTSLLVHSPPRDAEFLLFLPCLLGLKHSLALNLITFCQSFADFLGSHCWLWLLCHNGCGFPSLSCTLLRIPSVADPCNLPKIRLSLSGLAQTSLPEPMLCTWLTVYMEENVSSFTEGGTAH